MDPPHFFGWMLRLSSRTFAVIGAFYPARAASGPGRLRLIVLRRFFVVIPSDRRRKRIERHAMIVIVGRFGHPAIAARLSNGTLRTIVPIFAVPRTTARLALFGFGFGAGLGFCFDQFLAVIVVIVVSALSALLFEAHATLAQDAEIMVRELQEIFGLDAVTG